MIIKEISKEEFDSYAKNHMLKNYYQSSNYGDLLSKFGYKALYIGAFIDNKIVAGSLILSKYITINIKYGYAPRGFLIDYYDEELLRLFTKKVKSYFFKRGYAFIKINPEVTLSQIDYKTNYKNISEKAVYLMERLEGLNYKKLKNNLYFESLLPKYNAIVELKSYNDDILEKQIRKRLNLVDYKGISIYKGDEYNLNTFYELVKRKIDNRIEYYKNYYKLFNKDNEIDLWLVDVDYHEYLENIQKEYTVEIENNDVLNQIFKTDSNNKQLLLEKMASDKKVADLNQELIEINGKIQNGIFNETIASALIIKYDNRVNLLLSGFSKKHVRLYPNYYLHTKLLNYYKEQNYKFFDLNGVAGDFSKDNPYKGLNDFKLKFNPNIYEYIGEFDLIVNQTIYALLWSTKLLHNEFDKKDVKNNN